MISQSDKYQIIIGTFLYLLLIGFGKTIFMNNKIDSTFIVYSTLGLLMWLIVSKLITNFISEYYLDNMN